MNSLTYVGDVLYGSETASVTPEITTLVKINSANGAITVIGQLPSRIDAIAGIPIQPSSTTAALTPIPSVPQGSTTLQSIAAAPVAPIIRIAKRAISLRQLLVGAHDVKRNGSVRRITPLFTMARFGVGERAELVSRGGDTLVVSRDAPGLALLASSHHGLKLIDVRNGFERIFGDIVEVRNAAP